MWTEIFERLFTVTEENFSGQGNVGKKCSFELNAWVCKTKRKKTGNLQEV
jgi:hypothetical protein